MQRYQIHSFQVQEAGHNKILVLIAGSENYKAILQRAFPTYKFSRSFEARSGRFDWGTYVYDIPPAVQQRIKDFLEVLTVAICIEDDLTECFALDFHSEIGPAGPRRTVMGQLVYEAKPYRPGTGSTTKADELAGLMSVFIQGHPTYAAADVLIAVPPSNPNKPFDLPTYLVQRLASLLGKPNATDWVRKVRATRPMKDCVTPQEKLDNVRGAFAITAAADFAGKSVIMIDDIYQSGFTINEVSHVVAESGANRMLGLAATKTFAEV